MKTFAILAVLVGGTYVTVRLGDAREPAAAPPAVHAAVVLAAPAAASAQAPAQAPGQDLQVIAIADAGAALDPDHADWLKAPPLQVPLLPQQIAMPRLMTATVASVEARAMADGKEIAFRVQWQDATKDELVEQSRFGDGVALQFPLDKDAPFIMGAEGLRVHVLNWKAQWQRDVDRGFQDVEDTRPNTWSDLYWFTKGERPYRVPDSFRDERSHAWFPAMVAGNAVARWDRKQPVEELVAAGFGTSRNRKTNNTRARGVWRDGTWTVVLVRPMKTGDELDYPFDGSKQELVGFAVWNGSAENVGGRKHHSMWTPFTRQVR